MKLGYNTNGLAHHSIVDAIELLADIGYRTVAVTIDHGVLNPFSHGLGSQIDKLNALAAERDLTYVVETGARFLLDPRQKHEPTLVSPTPEGRSRRVDFLLMAVQIAADLEAECVSLWSGVVHDQADRETAWRRLTDALPRVIRESEKRGVTLAFEPEPGMLVATLDDYAALKRRLGPAAEPLRLTIDIGHLHCQREDSGGVSIADLLRRWRGEVANIHIEDMRRGVHEHLMFGDGEIDFPPIVAALGEIGYDGPLCVELSRHSHDGPNAARRAFNFLAGLP
ncbi:MAG: sugar phosphate isomerase/epimerase family protein [Planctomycetota bacterium]